SATLHGADTVLEQLIANYETGSILRRGVTTAIVGSPNVGKSTLLNLLSGYEKAIVTPIAGTTRDVVEQEISLAGTTLLLADTAGLRETEDLVEAEGIRRSMAHFEDANLVLAVFDGSVPLSDGDKALAERCRGRLALAVINKSDLPRVLSLEPVADCFSGIVQLSAKDEKAMQPLTEAIRALLFSKDIDPDTLLLANQRQLSCARSAKQALAEAIGAQNTGFALDAVSVCVDDALSALYELTGESASEAVIEEVFSKFCVGK
ncbi:MAG: GTPase, partial [Pygmaiobacter sp.]